MAVDYTPPTFSGGLPSAIALTQAFADIQIALQYAVSVNGGSPNQMEADLDMNGRNILNVGALDTEDDTTAPTIDLGPLETAVDLLQSNVAALEQTDLTQAAINDALEAADTLLSSNTVTINTRAQNALDKADQNELDIVDLSGRVVTLETSQTQQSLNISELQLDYNNLAGRVTTNETNIADVGASSPSGWQTIHDSNWTTLSAYSTKEYSTDFTGEADFLDDNGETDAYKVTVNQDTGQAGANYGATEIFELTGRPQEVEMKFKFFVPTTHSTYWASSDSNMKMPGLSGKASNLNGGYGGSQNSYLLKQYRAPSARLQLHRPDPTFGLALGGEKYWQGSTNSADGGPTPGEGFRAFGDTFWVDDTDSASAADKVPVGQWIDVYQRMKINTPGNADGELEVMWNNKVSERTYETGIEWVTAFPGYEEFMEDNKLVAWQDAEEMFQIQRVWFDVYHGGNSKSTPGPLVLYFRDFQYQVLS